MLWSSLCLQNWEVNFFDKIHLEPEMAITIELELHEMLFHTPFRSKMTS